MHRGSEGRDEIGRGSAMEACLDAENSNLEDGVL